MIFHKKETENNELVAKPASPRPDLDSPISLILPLDVESSKHRQFTSLVFTGGCYDYCKRRQPDLQSENNNRHQVCFTWLICCSNVLGQKKVQKQVCLVSSSNTKTSKEAADVSLHTLFFSLSKPCTAKTAIPSFHSH